jgi:hypothetical protein
MCLSEELLLTAVRLVSVAMLDLGVVNGCSANMILERHSPKNGRETEFTSWLCKVSHDSKRDVRIRRL